jgi:ribosome biogenesis protein ENP2
MHNNAAMRNSGGSSRDARANHRDPHGHVTWSISLSFFYRRAFFFYDQVESSFKLVHLVAMKLSNQSEVPVYTISGSNTARPLPEWLARRRKRSLKDDPEYANRIELLQDFEFEEASQCVKVSEDGEWVMSTGMIQ